MCVPLVFDMFPADKGETVRVLRDSGAGGQSAKSLPDSGQRRDAKISARRR